MRLLDLEPQFLKRVDDEHFDAVQTIDEADGVIFVCPKCIADNGGQRAGVHSVICWRPRVPQTTTPTPGRWEFEGTGLQDLTLVAGSSSILLLPPSCGAHFFIRNGFITY